MDFKTAKNQLKDLVKNCPFYNNQKVVIGTGSLNPNFLFIKAVPCDKSENKYKEWVNNKGLEKTAVINAVPFVTLDDNGERRTPKKEEVEYFRSAVKDVVQSLNPKRIVCLGKTACKSMDVILSNKEWQGNIGFINCFEAFEGLVEDIKPEKSDKQEVIFDGINIIRKDKVEVKDEMKNFNHLHVHTEYSVLDGANRIDDLVKFAKGKGAKNLAITDHRVIGGWYPFNQACNIYGIKPVFGCEIEVGIKELNTRYHLVLLAKDQEGFENIIKLCSLGWEHTKKPLVEYKDLEKYNKGIIASSACLSGEVSKTLMKNEDALTIVNRYKNIFGDDFYLEIMPLEMPEQIDVNKQIIELAKQTNTKIICTNDVHYQKPDDWEIQDILLCIKFRRKKADKERPKYDTHEIYFKNKAEMVASFNKYNPEISDLILEEAFANTEKIADSCNAKFVMHKNLMPVLNEETYPFFKEPDFIEFKKGKDCGLTEAFFDYLINKGMETRGFAGKKEYLERAQLEKEIIVKKGYIDYFLVVYAIYDYCDKNNIYYGVGRGSVAGSLIAYLIGLTEVDPLKYNLLFQRFIDETRVDLPDIDMDFEDERRGDVKKFIEEFYGKDKVASITNYGKLKERMVLDDLARILSIPSFVIMDIKNKLISRSSGDARQGNILRDTLELFPDLNKHKKNYPQLFKYAERLENITRSRGVHACGVLVTPKPVTNYCGTESHKGVKTTCYTGKECESMGLLKLDVLGLRTLSIIRQTEQFINNKIAWKDVDFEDKDTLNDFANGYTVGVFQFVSKGMAEMCRQMKVDCFEDVIAINALFRPATLRNGMASQYIERKHNPGKAKPLHPALAEITAESKGLVLYQEQIMRIFVEFAGFFWKDTGKIRKLISKSKGIEAFNMHRDKFIEGALKKGATEEEANEIFDAIYQFGSFSFNRSHSVAYAMMSYKTMWLKTKYPKEFLCATLKYEDNHAELVDIINECKRKGVKLLKPDINKSQAHYSVEDEGIRPGLKKVKYLGATGIKKVLDSRPYTDFNDFLERSKLNKRAVKNLILAGFCDCFNNNRRGLVETFETGTPSFNIKDWDDDEKQMIALEIYPVIVDKHILDYHKEEINKEDKLITFEELNKIIDTKRTVDSFWKEKFKSAVVAEVKPYWANWGDWLPQKPDVMDKGLSKFPWWSQWCKISILDKQGISKYCNVNPNVFAKHEDILKAIKINTPLLIEYEVSNKSQRLSILRMKLLGEKKNG